MTLEERIKCIICESEIELELEGEAYRGKYELNNAKSIKEFIFDKLRLNYKGEKKIYINADTGEKIIISHGSAGKLATRWKNGEAYQKSLAYIPLIIEKDIRWQQKRDD